MLLVVLLYDIDYLGVLQWKYFILRLRAVEQDVRSITREDLLQPVKVEGFTLESGDLRVVIDGHFLIALPYGVVVTVRGLRARMNHRSSEFVRLIGHSKLLLYANISHQFDHVPVKVPEPVQDNN